MEFKKGDLIYVVINGGGTNCYEFENDEIVNKDWVNNWVEAGHENLCIYLGCCNHGCFGLIAKVENSEIVFI